MDQPEQDAGGQLPVIRIIAEAFLFPFVCWRALFTTLRWPVVATVAAYTMAQLFYVYDMPGLMLLGILLLGAGFVYLAVACHRYVLMGAEAVHDIGRLRWSWRETRFLGWVLAIWFLACFAGFLVPALIFTIWSSLLSTEQESAIWAVILIGLLGFGVAAFVFGRMALLLPATALDRRENIGWAFDRSAGNAWRMAVVAGVLPMLLSELPGLMYWMGDGFAVIVLLGLVTVLFWIVEIVALSLSYRELADEPEATPENEGPLEQAT